MDELREIYLENIDSTNLWAKNNIETLVDKTVVFAGTQTQGRGRLQRSWVDLGQGNLFMSLVLKPAEKFDARESFANTGETLERRTRQRSHGLANRVCQAGGGEPLFMEHYANLTQYMSVSLCKVLENYGLNPEIKWPNDVLINSKKIAGILSEASVRGTTFKGLVLGIGVNLNAKEEDFVQIDKKVTALNLELGREIDLKEFKTALVEEFFKNYETFLSLGFEFIKKDYLSRANFLDKELCVALINETKTGVAKGVTSKGELVLANGENEFVLNIGDIL